jgi:hypothetical protein
MKDDQEAFIPLKPGGLIMVPPDKQVGESEFRDLRRVQAQKLVKQRFVLDLYWFEITHSKEITSTFPPSLREPLQQAFGRNRQV